jgi:hypothetical protein
MILKIHLEEGKTYLDEGFFLIPYFGTGLTKNTTLAQFFSLGGRRAKRRLYLN